MEYPYSITQKDVNQALDLMKQGQKLKAVKLIYDITKEFMDKGMSKLKWCKEFVESEYDSQVYHKSVPLICFDRFIKGETYQERGKNLDALESYLNSLNTHDFIELSNGIKFVKQ